MKPLDSRSNFLGATRGTRLAVQPVTRQAILAAALAALPLASSQAQTAGTWNLTPTTGLTWNTTTNWTGLTGGLVPNAIGAAPNFTSNIGGARTITLDGSKTVGTLTIDDSAATFFGFTLNAGTPSTSQLIFDVASGNAGLNSATSGNTATNAIGAGITLNDPLVINWDKTNSTGVLNLNGVITDGAASLGITKNGSGLVQLAGVNTYDGGTTINGGRLGAGSATSYGTGSVTVGSGGQAWLSSGATYGNNFAIAGLGSANADVAALNGAIRFGGATTTGTINIAAAARIGGYSGASGTLAGPLTGSAALEINQSGASHNGNLILTGNAGGYTGTITVSQGTLRLGTASNLGGSLVVNDGANLHVENIGTPGAATVGTDSGATRSLTLGNPGSTTTGPNLFIDPSTGDALQVNGNVILNGLTTVNLAGEITSNPVKILGYSGTLTGILTGTGANLTLPGGLSAYRTGTEFTASGGEVNLTLVIGDIIWTGAATSNWNTTESNWTDGSNPTTFYNLDNVTFDDTAGTTATFTTNLANAVNNDLVFTAVASGAAGEAVIIQYVNPGVADSPLGVTVTGSTVSVSLGTDSLSAISSSANAIKTVIEASGPASALVTVALAAGNDGSGLVAALSATPLALTNPGINLATGVTVSPGNMTFNHGVIDYTVSGSGIIAGGGSLTKSGTGTLTLSTSNTFSGEVAINAGILRLGNAGALGGAGTKVVTVNDGGRLDFAGFAPGGTRGYSYKIAGNGGGLGALHNSSATGIASDAGVLNLELLADATVGGSQAAGRFDLGFTNGVSGVIKGNGFKLTKTGLNQINLRGNASATPIVIDVVQGSLIVEDQDSALGGATGSVTVGSGATLGAFGARTIATPITLASGATLTSLSSTGIWTGPVTLTGNARITGNGAAGVTVQGNIDETGGPNVLTLENISTAVDTTLSLSGTNTHSGGTTVKGAIVVANNNGAFGTGSITVQGNGTVARVTRVQLGTNVVLPAANGFVLDSNASAGVGAITSYAGDPVTPSTAIVNGPVQILQTVGGAGHFASNKGSASVLRVMGAVTSPNGVSVTVRQGVVEFGGGGDYADLQIVDGTLKLAANAGLDPDATLRIGTSGTAGDTGTFDLNGFSQTLAGLGTGARPATVTNTGASPSTLTLDLAGSSTFAGTFAAGISPLSLVKAGAGTLTFSASSSSFTGGLSVTGGGVNLPSAVTFGAAGATAQFGTGTTLSGEGTFGGDLTLGGTTLNVNGTTPLSVLASGNLNTTGGVTVNLQSLPPTPGPIVIIAFNGALTGSAANFTLAGAASYRSPVFTVGANSVTLTLGSPVDLTWTGTGGSDWDIDTTTNWNDPFAVASTFFTADSVTFGNTGGATIGVPATVSASNLVINSNDNWLFQGAGTVSAATVTKNGTGSATFETPVSFPGSIALTTGILRLSPPTGVTSTLAGTITGAGTLAKGGDGILSVPGANPGFTGSMVISKGEVIPGNNGAFGTAKVFFGDSTTQATDICTLTLNSGTALATSQLEVAATCLNARISSTGGTIVGTTITKKGAGKLTIGHATDPASVANVLTGTSPIIIEQGTLAGSSMTPISSSTTITMGNANTGTAPTIVELPANQTPPNDVVTLACPLVLSPDAPNSEAIFRYAGGTSQGSLSYSGAISLNGRDLFLENTSNVNTPTRLYNVTGVISGNGSVRVRGGSGTTIRVQANNTFTGDFYMLSGALQTAFNTNAVESIPNTARIIMSAGARFSLSNTAETVRGLVGGAATETVTTSALFNQGRGDANTCRLTVNDSTAANTHVFDGRLADGAGPIAFTKAGAATQVLNGVNSYTGTTIVTGGTLEIGGAGQLGSGTYSSAMTLTSPGILKFNSTADQLLQTGVISSTGSLVKENSGTLTLTAANSFSGNITVGGGKLIGAGATNGSPGVSVFGSRVNTRTFTINNGGTLQFNSGNILGAGHTAITAPKLVINSGGVVTNGGIATNNALNDVELNGGTLTSTTGHTSSSDPFAPVYGAWNLNGAVTSTGTSTISTTDPTKGWIMLKVVGDKTTNFNVTSGTLTVSAPVVDNPTDSNIGSLNKSGAGTMEMTGANTYTGATTVSQGTLSLVGGSQTSPVTVNAGASLGFTLDSPTISTSTFNLSAGTIKITGTPISASYDLITSSAGITGTPVLAPAVPGYALKVEGTSLKLVQAGYATWAAINAIGSTPDQDKDLDGVSNAVEYVLGGDVNTNDLGKLPTVATSGADMVFSFKRATGSIDGSTVVSIEVGTTLITFPVLYAVPDGAVSSNPGVTVVKNTPAGFDTVTLTIPRSPDPAKFARLKATVTE